VPKVHTHLRQLKASLIDGIERELFSLPEYPGTDGNGWLLGTLNEVRALMAQSRHSDLIVRFRDGGFSEITTAWRWLGDGVGVAHLIVGGAVGQIHLMLAGTETEQTSVARAWLKRAGVMPESALPPQPMLSLISVEREGYGDHVGGYLLGMILIAPFAECCGVPDDPA
jgi:hypothetical protein